jgi:hypothetical protein
VSRVALALVITAAGAAAVYQLPKRPVVASTPHVGQPTFSDVPPVTSRSARRVPLPAATPVRGRQRDSHLHLAWDALAQCESSGNPHAVDPSGTYFGLYQFDLETWRSVGGHGNPADASPEEQRKRAWLLYIQRGRAPWPVCGVNL